MQLDEPFPQIARRRFRDLFQKDMLPESILKKLGVSPEAGLQELDDWLPVTEETPGRRLSAPSRRLCGVTDIGKIRDNNEDEYFLSPDERFWIVADGMGGHHAGEVASALTIEAIVAAIDSAGTYEIAGDRLLRAFGAAQESVSERSLRDHECRGMGSTAIAGLVDGAELNICHVGDVRAYHWSAGRLRRLTADHSFVWQLVLSGLLTPDQARIHPHRSKVTQAIGHVSGVKPDLTKLTLRPRDRVLLCSDGLWEAMPDEDIGTVVGLDGSMHDLATLLVDKANAAGGQDNISAVLYEHAPLTIRSGVA
jgi:protein phosphatase